MCRALSYILQSISAETGFGALLNQPIPPQIAIPSKWSTSGTASDFFVTVGLSSDDFALMLTPCHKSIYYIVATTSGSLNFLYPALIIALANAAPHLQNLQIQSSTKLVQLFISFSNPSFLLADESHPRLIFFM